MNQGMHKPKGNLKYSSTIVSKYLFRVTNVHPFKRSGGNLQNCGFHLTQTGQPLVTNLIPSAEYGEFLLFTKRSMQGTPGWHSSFTDSIDVYAEQKLRVSASAATLSWSSRWITSKLWPNSSILHLWILYCSMFSCFLEPNMKATGIWSVTVWGVCPADSVSIFVQLRWQR